MAVTSSSWLRERTASRGCGSGHSTSPRRGRSQVPRTPRIHSGRQTAGTSRSSREAPSSESISTAAPLRCSAPPRSTCAGAHGARPASSCLAPDQVSGLLRVPASGGTTVGLELNGGNEKNLNRGARWPHFVADNGRFLFQRRGEIDSHVYVGSLDGAIATQLVATDWGAQVSQGFLLFLKGTTLMAQAFGPGDTLTGDAVPLRTNVAGDSSGYAAFSTSKTGILAYANPVRAIRELRWFSRTGISARPGRAGRRLRRLPPVAR